jgi:pimeloyl-ACP methyl ester carboxylesterase
MYIVKYRPDFNYRYDYPATIDHILNVTGAKALDFVGYSMGTTQYLIMLSELPEYNAKIRKGFLLGPTAFGGHSGNFLTKFAGQANLFESTLTSLGIAEFLPTNLEFNSKMVHIVYKANFVNNLLFRYWVQSCIYFLIFF